MEIIDNISVNAINSNKTTINDSHENTYYNKISCRICGDKLMVIKKRSFCDESINWMCEYCSALYDSVHIHRLSIE
jgi:hypothetical protein